MVLRATAAGELTINGLNIRDTSENERLLAWERMYVDRYELDSESNSARYPLSSTMMRS